MKKHHVMRYRLVMIMLTVCSLSAFAKGGNERQVYMFGFATSFMDSVVYVTSIQPVSPVTWERHTRVLSNRSGYTEQMRYYLNNEGLTDRTIVVFFDKDKKKVEKRLQKLHRRYVHKQHYAWKEIGEDAFRFKVSEQEKE